MSGLGGCVARTRGQRGGGGIAADEGEAEVAQGAREGGDLPRRQGDDEAQGRRKAAGFEEIDAGDEPEAEIDQEQHAQIHQQQVARREVALPQGQRRIAQAHRQIESQYRQHGAAQDAPARGAARSKRGGE